MDYNKIENLIKLVSESNLTDFAIESEGISLKMKKEKVVVEHVGQATMPVYQTEVKPMQQQIATPTTTVTVENVGQQLPKENEVVITSPIVGTFYQSSTPGGDAFVKVGSKVKKGELLCIVEAMKLMNEIESEVDGEITEILVKNEQIIEYGQPLFKIIKA